jgi:hypothetical protein
VFRYGKLDPRGVGGGEVFETGKDLKLVRVAGDVGSEPTLISVIGVIERLDRAEFLCIRRVGRNRRVVVDIKVI